MLCFRALSVGPTYKDIFFFWWWGGVCVCVCGSLKISPQHLLVSQDLFSRPVVRLSCPHLSALTSASTAAAELNHKTLLSAHIHNNVVLWKDWCGENMPTDFILCECVIYYFKVVITIFYFVHTFCYSSLSFFVLALLFSIALYYS